MTRKNWTEFTCDAPSCGNQATDEMVLRTWYEVGFVYWSGIIKQPRSYCSKECAIEYLQGL